MKIKEILALEKENQNQIILLKEGIFWRAYNMSAFLFTKNIEEYKVTKKYRKVVNAEIVYLGFPHTVLEKILEKAKINFTVILEEEKKLVLQLNSKIYTALGRIPNCFIRSLTGN